MKFESANAMLDIIQSGMDLYNINTGEYVFSYSDKGAIAAYIIDENYAKELSFKSVETDEYWGAYLGVGGSIYEDGAEVKWCEEHYNIGGWKFTNDLDMEWNRRKDVEVARKTLRECGIFDKNNQLVSAYQDIIVRSNDNTND